MKQIQKLFQIYIDAGEADYIGEAVTQLAHAGQAAQLAYQAKAPASSILAAFFHDIGHICAPKDAPQMEGLGVVDHENLGADFLREHGFDGDIAELVSMHVQAKRYLGFTNPSYVQRLSPASLGTLAFQGGVMTEEEAHKFKSHRLFKEALRLRAWDEAAKIVGGNEISFSKLEELAQEYKETAQ